MELELGALRRVCREALQLGLFELVVAYKNKQTKPLKIHSSKITSSSAFTTHLGNK